MMQSIRPVLLAVLPFVLPVPALAVPDSEVAKCAAMKNKVDRLLCYDALATSLQVPRERAPLSAATVEASASETQSETEYSPAFKFRSTVAGAIFQCSSTISLIAQSVRLHGSPRTEYIVERNDCVAQKSADIKASFKALKESAPGAGVLDAAKDVYVAASAMLKLLATATSRENVDRSSQKADLDKSIALFELEADL